MTEEGERCAEANVLVAIEQHAIHVCDATRVTASAINQVVASYSQKMCELIAQCETIDDVHDVLGIRAAPIMAHRCCEGTE